MKILMKYKQLERQTHTEMGLSTKEGKIQDKSSLLTMLAFKDFKTTD
jgi:hypothetical protein